MKDASGGLVKWGNTYKRCLIIFKLHACMFLKTHKLFLNSFSALSLSTEVMNDLPHILHLHPTRPFNN